jgi:hypothetical protein
MLTSRLFWAFCRPSAASGRDTTVLFFTLSVAGTGSPLLFSYEAVILHFYFDGDLPIRSSSGLCCISHLEPISPEVPSGKPDLLSAGLRGSVLDRRKWILLPAMAIGRRDATLGVFSGCVLEKVDCSRVFEGFFLQGLVANVTTRERRPLGHRKVARVDHERRLRG